MYRSPSTRYVSLSLLSLVLACGDDSSTTSDSDTETTSTTGTTGTTTNTTTTDTTTTDTATTDTTTTDGATTTDGTTTDGTTTDGTTDGTGTSGSTGGLTGAAAVCGDGVLTAGAEVCDDGNVYDGDGCSSDCQTANCLVPITHASVQLGVDDVGCSTVWILPGTYTENVVADRSVILEGIPIDLVTIDGNGAGTAVETDAPSLALRNLTITNGMATTGGGIRANGTSITLERSTVTGNLVTGSGSVGGGVALLDGSLTLVESNIDSNYATGVSDTRQGAGVYAENSTIVVTSDSSLSFNTASSAGNNDGEAEGGGIYAVNTVLLINGGSRIEQNTAEVTGATTGGNVAGGGGVYLTGGNSLLVVGDASISQNTASVVSTGGTSTAEGGGVVARSGAQVDLGPGALIDSNAVDASGPNTRVGGGGLSLFQGAEVALDGATVTNNTVDSTATSSGQAVGGGVELRDASLFALDMSRSTVSGNVVSSNTNGVATALAVGGGMHLSTDADSLALYEVRETTLSGNQVTGNDDSDGGAVLFEAPNSNGDGQLDFLNSTISGNTSDAVDVALGGGVSVSAAVGDSSLFVINSTVTGNTATTGGGFSVDDTTGSGSATGTVRHSIVFDNVATTGSMCFGALGQTTPNVIGPVLTDCMIATDSQIQMDPMLGALADNGGPTFTHAIDNASVAYNAGDPNCQDNGLVIPNDQRGLPRTDPCTIGSYEPQ